MSNGQGSKFPATGVAGGVLLLVTLLTVTEKPYVLTRPAEPRHAAYELRQLQKVDARLWQDPYSTIERYEHQVDDKRAFDIDAYKHGVDAHAIEASKEGRLDAKGLVRCDEEPRRMQRPRTESGAAVADSRDLFGVDVCVVRSQIRSIQRTPPFPRKLLVLGVTVFGNPYVGAEEDRRRTRYAVVSALDSAGYVPTDNERIGYMQVPIEKGSTIALPFEFFERYQTGKPEDPHSRGKLLADHILLLWMDDTRLAESDNWLGHVKTLLQNVIEPCLAPENDGGAREGAAGPPDCELRIVGPSSSDLFWGISNEKGSLAGLLPGQAEVLAFSPFVTSTVLTQSRKLQDKGLHVVPTIAPDSRVIQALLAELHVRGLPMCNDSDDVLNSSAARDDPGARQVIVLLSEWDTQYGARIGDTFADAFDGLYGSRCHAANHLARFSFIRGLDGQLPGRPQASAASAQNAQSAQPNPSSPDGSDIEWPETNDQRDYIRRLGERIAAQLNSPRGNTKVAAVGVVASDAHDKLLLLQAMRERFRETPFFTIDVDARLAHPLVRKWTRNLIVASSFGLTLRARLQGAIPPFRDSYQTATYLAALASLQEEVSEPTMQRWISSPEVFEVGTTQIVPMGMPETADVALDPGLECAPMTLYGCAGVTSSRNPTRPPWRELAYTFALMALAVAVGAGLLLRDNGLETLNPRGELRRQSPARFRLAWLLLGGVVAVGSVLIFLILESAGVTTAFRPREPVFLAEGISTWPTVLLRVTALTLTLFFLFRIAVTVRPRFEATEREFIGKPPSAESVRQTEWVQKTWLGWVWDEIRVKEKGASRGDTSERRSISAVWANYKTLARGWARARRVGLFAAVLLFVIVGIFWWAPEPVVLARGPLRVWLESINVAIFVSLSLLVAFVADSTILCAMFVATIGRRRTRYESSVIEDTLGRYGIVRELSPHIDSWIDTELIAARTAAVGTYLYYPFIVIAILIVSMSSIFDDWTFNWGRVAFYGLEISIVVGLWFLLRAVAERARTIAIAELDLSVMHVMADPASSAVPQMKDQLLLLRDRVVTMRKGAFTSTFDQPVVRALLLPLSGLSAVQVAEFFFAR